MTRLSVLAGKFSCCQVIDARKVVAFYSDSVERQQCSTQVAAAQQRWDHPLWCWLKPCQIALTRVKWIPAIFAKLTDRTAPGCGITKMTSELRDGFTGGKACRTRERASERLSAQPPPPDEAPNTNKEKWSGNAAVLRLHSCRRIAGFPAWKPLTQLRRNAQKEKNKMKSRGERKRHQSCAGPYWRAQSPSACGGRAAASTPRPSAAGPGPSLPARREPPRSPGPGARTLAARPPAPEWQDVPLGPPDSQLGNTNVKGKRIKLCNHLLVDRGISMTDVAVIFLFTFLVFYMPHNHLR